MMALLLLVVVLVVVVVVVVVVVEVVAVLVFWWCYGGGVAMLGFGDHAYADGDDNEVLANGKDDCILAGIVMLFCIASWW